MSVVIPKSGGSKVSSHMHGSDETQALEFSSRSKCLDLHSLLAMLKNGCAFEGLVWPSPRTTPMVPLGNSTIESLSAFSFPSNRVSVISLASLCFMNFAIASHTRRIAASGGWNCPFGHADSPPPP